jgi:hypothetical protein
MDQCILLKTRKLVSTNENTFTVFAESHLATITTSFTWKAPESKLIINTVKPVL